MYCKFITIILLLGISAGSNCQIPNNINQMDAKGEKQGYWIKKYPDGQILYEGSFRNNKPVGEFKRYYEDGSLKSVLMYSDKKMKHLRKYIILTDTLPQRVCMLTRQKRANGSFFHFP